MDEKIFLPFEKNKKKDNRDDIMIEVKTKHGVIIKMLLSSWVKIEDKFEYEVLNYY